ncbi:hypothetical protein ACCO45_001807 [Purpureocillium lilacinum]|uniref:Uncharacterized protein n=1 Tax=Purpureocillium lilacinum TaxID=33203 RepID=A0ACC4E9C0_PURLI
MSSCLPNPPSTEVTEPAWKRESRPVLAQQTYNYEGQRQRKARERMMVLANRGAGPSDSRVVTYPEL